MATETRPAYPLQISCTGFGPFGSVAVNPSATLVSELLEAALAPAVAEGVLCWAAPPRVLEVAAASATEAIQQLWATVQQCPSTHDVLIVHFGVDAGRGAALHLETQAVNDCTFRIPDAAGWKPSGTPVDTSDDVGSVRTTSLPTAALAEKLSAQGHSVAASHDAGRFLCNYSYYRSLVHASRANAAAIAAGETRRFHALFVHVPPVEALALPAQVAAVVALLRACALSREELTVSEGGGAVVPMAPSSASLTHALSELGFAADVITRAVAALDPMSSVEEGIEWALAHASSEESPPSATVSAVPAFDLSGIALPSPPKLTIVVRPDLCMSPGKVAAQACHGALRAARNCDPAMLSAWRAAGEPIIVLRGPDAPGEGPLLALIAAAGAAGLRSCSVRDAGRTQVDPGSMTVACFGPAPAREVDVITGQLRLF